MNQHLHITAPAKINLFLHVIGKRQDGYHRLQSLTAFSSDFGDEIIISPADEFKFSFDSTSENFPVNENNLIICAANLLAEAVGRKLECHIHLTKKIPIGAGLGGGSSDAAATIKGLLQFWNASLPPEKLENILLTLGADVPSCYHGKACYFEDIGETITPIEDFPTLHAVLVYPNKHCATKNIFEKYDGHFSKEVTLPEEFKTTAPLLKFISAQKNDLTIPAIKNIPEIEDILQHLKNETPCQLARMSGSGSACFALFNTKEEAEEAATNIKKTHQKWWVQSVTLR